jgi:Dolichyl-phosphate-mannose-protein mannosyltransferase
MSLAAYVGGLGVFLVLAACAAATGTIVTRRRFAGIEPAARAVAWGLVTATALAVGELVPLVLGVLSRGTAIAASLLVLGGAWVFVRRDERAPEPRRVAPESSTAATALAAVAIAAAVVYVVAFLAHVRGAPIGDYDSTSFILPVPSRWLQTGSLWHFDDLVPGWGYGAYPQTGSVFQLLALLPWHNDFALRLVNVPFMALAALAAYALACELGAARAFAGTCAVAAVMLPATAAHALDHAQTDVIMAAGLTSGALFLARHARTRAHSDLVLAGVGLGLSFGVKWYAGPEVAALLIVWALAWLFARARLADVLRDGLVVVGLIALLGGVWLVRNLVVSGNPLFPGRVTVLGATVFAGPAATAGDPVNFSLLHYATQPSILRHYVWPAFKTSYGLSGLLLALGWLVGALRAWSVERRVVVVAVAALAVFVTYTAMPYSALGPANHPSFVTAATRYSGAALLLASVVAAWALTSLPRPVALFGQAALVVAVVAGMTHYDDQVGSGRFNVPAHVLAETAVGVLVAAAVVLVLLRRPRRPGFALAFAAVLVVLAVVAVAGRRVEQSFNSERYRGVNPAFDWVDQHSRSGERIALSGQPDRDFDAAPFIAFGPRLQNRVTFIGTRDHHLLTRYTAPRPFLRMLAAGRYDALLVGADVTGPARELAWARSAGWRLAANGGTFTLLVPPRGNVSG